MSAIEGSRRHPYGLVAALAAITLICMLTPTVGFSADGCAEFVKSYARDKSGSTSLPDNKKIDHTLALGCHVYLVRAANKTLKATYEIDQGKLAIGFQQKLELNNQTAARFATATERSVTSKWFRWPVRIVGAVGAMLVVDDLYNLVDASFETTSESPSISARETEKRMLALIDEKPAT